MPPLYFLTADGFLTSWITRDHCGTIGGWGFRNPHEKDATKEQIAEHEDHGLDWDQAQSVVEVDHALFPVEGVFLTFIGLLELLIERRALKSLGPRM